MNASKNEYLLTFHKPTSKASVRFFQVTINRAYLTTSGIK
jgi:hypothetical protein